MHIKLLSFVPQERLWQEFDGMFLPIVLDGDEVDIDYLNEGGRFSFGDDGTSRKKAKYVSPKTKACGIFLHDLSFVDTDEDGETDKNGKTIFEYLDEHPDDMVYCIDAHI